MRKIEDTIVVNRKTYIDYLNVFACLAVIYMHHNGLSHHYDGTYSWYVSLIIEVICYWAVPVFFMISGANLITYLRRYDTFTFLKKRVLKVVIPWLAWSVITLFLQCVKGSVVLHELTYSEAISMIMNCEIISVYWFFPAIISIYLMMPILSVIDRDVESSRKVFWYIVMVEFVVTYCIPLITDILNIRYRDDMFTEWGGYILYVILGFLLSTADLSKKKRGFIYLLAISSCLFRYITTAVMSYYSGVQFDLLFSYKQFHAVFLAVGVFIFFKYRSFNNSHINKIFNKLAKGSFGIYLTHILVEYQLVEKVWIWTGLSWNLLAPIVTFAFSLLIVIVIRHIPVIRNIIP